MELNTVKENYLKGLRDKQATLAGTKLLKEKRDQALAKFEAEGFPHTKLENWLYTSIKPALIEDYQAATKVDFDGDLTAYQLDPNFTLVFVDGALDENQSKLPEGLSLIKLSTDDEWSQYQEFLTLPEQDSFEAINLASFEQAYALEIEKKKTFDSPLSIVHVHTKENAGTHKAMRFFVKANSLSELSIIESFVCAGDKDLAYTTNTSSTLLLEEGAKIIHIKAQMESDKALHRGRVCAHLKRDAHFDTYTMSLGARLSRNDLEVHLNAEGAHANVDGLYALRGEQHADNFSLISHNAPHTESGQLFKGVLDDNSRGVFTGKVLVARDAQKVDSAQLNKNLLLSKKAHVDTRPQLEVYADDVKCAHGATVGQINEDEVFYLRSRGMSDDRAQKILCHAFASEVIEKIQSATIRKKLQEFLYKEFERFALGEDE